VELKKHLPRYPKTRPYYTFEQSRHLGKNTSAIRTIAIPKQGGLTALLKRPRALFLSGGFGEKGHTLLSLKKKNKPPL